MKKLFYLTALMGFLMSCSSTPKEEIKQPQKTNSRTATVKVSGLNLPITTNWRDWHCQNNYSFSAAAVVAKSATTLMDHPLLAES